MRRLSLCFLQALGREVSSEEEAREIQVVSVSGFGVRLCSRSEGERESGRTEDGWFPSESLQERNPNTRVLKLQQKVSSTLQSVSLEKSQKSPGYSRKSQR
ncbi:hypothetical protein ILYODFUR_027189 [Ilyodon furcidens]|uniref:Uncharacterized protein n=1 Tax=Ilyodon furcidens TaxID=33524 RepID=A0ABV0V8F2_9TELE